MFCYNLSERNVHVSSKRVLVATQSRTDNLATHVIGQWRKHGVLGIGESCVLPLEGQQHVARGALTVLGYYDLCLSMQVVALFVLVEIGRAHV